MDLKLWSIAFGNGYWVAVGYHCELCNNRIIRTNDATIDSTPWEMIIDS